MPVEKLRTVDQSPGDIHCGLSPFDGAGPGISRHYLQLFIRRETRKNHQIETYRELSWITLGLYQGSKLGALFNLALDMTRVQQVQPLGRRRTVVALRFQTGVARGTPEHFEEGAGDAAVCQRN